MSEAVALASSLPLPAPAGDAEESLRRFPAKRQSLKSDSSKHLTTQTSTDNVAPYQALPVQGSLISLNYTPALAVLEPDNMRKEVRREQQFLCPSVLLLMHFLYFLSVAWIALAQLQQLIPTGI